MLEGIYAKEVMTPKKGDHFLYSRSQMVLQNCLEEIMESEDPLQRGTNHQEVKISVETFNQARTRLDKYTKSRMTEACNDFLVDCRDDIIVITSNLEFSSTCTTNLDVMQESRIDDHRNVDVDRNLSDSSTRFTMFTLLNETLPKVYVVR